MDYIPATMDSTAVASTPKWPLTPDAIRYVVPRLVINELEANPLTEQCYPTAFGHYPRAVGHTMARAVHDDNLLIYCVNGRGFFDTSDASGDIRKGDILLLPENVKHRYGASDSEPWEIYWFHYSGSASRTLLEQTSYQSQNPIVQIGIDPHLISDFQRILQARRSPAQMPALVHVSCLLRQMLTSIGHRIREAQLTLRKGFNLGAIRSVMLSHLNGHLDLETLARATSLSKRHFITRYKALTGLPPIAHFIHLKMERACYLLDTTDKSIKEISADLGYDDPLYFSRLFCKIIGVSPSIYRKQHTNQ